jgi:hypothetical protein
MAEFIFVYHGGAKPSDDVDVAAIMGQWQTWMGDAGDAFVNMGAPVGMSKTVSNSGVVDNGGSNPTSGFSIVQAADMNAACELAKGCPIHESGGSVEVAEMMKM